jgi:hypothetical protein
MSARVFSRSDHVAGLVIRRQTIVGRRHRPLYAHGPRNRAAPALLLTIDELFGTNYAREHPEVLVVIVQSAASDWAASRLAVAIERVAEALVEPEEAQQRIVSASEFLRPRP